MNYLYGSLVTLAHLYTGSGECLLIESLGVRVVKQKTRGFNYKEFLQIGTHLPTPILPTLGQKVVFCLLLKKKEKKKIFGHQSYVKVTSEVGLSL